MSYLEHVHCAAIFSMCTLYLTVMKVVPHFRDVSRVYNIYIFTLPGFLRSQTHSLAQIRVSHTVFALSGIKVSV